MLSVTKNLDVFDPDVFKHPVHIIGCGATGSKIALEVAKLGIENISIYDFDKIEAHNISNQNFKLSDVDKYKVEALAEIIKETTGIEVKAFNKKVTGEDELSGILFILTDTMESRKEIFEECCRYNPSVKLVIETRMDVSLGYIYVVNPIDRKVLDKYEKTLYGSDEIVVKSACGTVPSIGATSSIISGMAVWQLIKFFHQENNSNYFEEENKENMIEYETIFSLNPFQLLCNN